MHGILIVPEWTALAVVVLVSMVLVTAFALWVAFRGGA